MRFGGVFLLRWWLNVLNIAIEALVKHHSPGSSIFPETRQKNIDTKKAAHLAMSGFNFDLTLNKPKTFSERGACQETGGAEYSKSGRFRHRCDDSIISRVWSV